MNEEDGEKCDELEGIIDEMVKMPELWEATKVGGDETSHLNTHLKAVEWAESRLREREEKKNE